MGAARRRNSALVCVATLATLSCVRTKPNPLYDAAASTSGAASSSTGMGSVSGATTTTDASRDTGDTACAANGDEDELAATVIDPLTVPLDDVRTRGLNIGQSDTTDWFEYTISASLSGDNIPWVFTAAGGLVEDQVAEICTYVSCMAASTQLWCDGETAESEAGFEGCCSGTGETFRTRFECGGQTDDALVRTVVRSASDSCNEYELVRRTIGGGRP